MAGGGRTTEGYDLAGDSCERRKNGRPLQGRPLRKSISCLTGTLSRMSSIPRVLRQVLIEIHFRLRHREEQLILGHIIAQGIP